MTAGDDETPPTSAAPIDEPPAPAPRAPDAPRAAPAKPPKFDRWAHRRGEPRMFVVLWSIFLLIAAIVTVFAVRPLGPPQPAMFRAAVQGLFAIAGAGVALLWPMTRLSQAAPARPLKAAAIDMLAILLPLQAVIWPTKLLTDWSWSVLAGAATMFLSWTILIGALIATATAGPLPAELGAPPRPGLAFGRTAWMLLCLILGVGAPAALLVGGLLGFRPDPAGWLASPVTAAHSMTSAASGLTARISRTEWFAATAPGVVGAAWWAVVVLFASGRRGTPPDRLQ